MSAPSHLSELLLVVAIVLTLGAMIIAVWPAVPVVEPHETDATVVSPDEQPPIRRGNATHDGNGLPWTHGLDGQLLPGATNDPTKAHVAYRGHPFGQ